ncbi:uncharacterized protein LOC120455136 isoform X2 [Drosophila santomea]|uniref:uncharacterized protein LOC120455136 isoform X2 n=1 Tax=Drosophila santomea TaxID=129105 RepID=UPI00195305B2|nr:uncharacterized protein LOC120455136 isoform X2 [Drosophila santomea]
MRWQLAIMWLYVSAFATPVIKWRRQIVTPKQLMAPPLSPISQDKVVVTPQKLREVADLKAMIQKAVDENSYVVAAAPSQEIPFIELMECETDGDIQADSDKVPRLHTNIVIDLEKIQFLMVRMVLSSGSVKLSVLTVLLNS